MEQIPLGDLGPAGLVAVAVLMILLGRLVPRSTLNDVKADRDHWRRAHEISEQARREQMSQMETLLEHARTTNAFIQSISKHSPSSDEGG